jgi:hypothetical protein
MLGRLPLHGGQAVPAPSGNAEYPLRSTHMRRNDGRLPENGLSSYASAQSGKGNLALEEKMINV